MTTTIVCQEICPNGKVVVVGPYVPNPLITYYRRVKIPGEVIAQCPRIVGPCAPWWFVRAHGFDKFFDSVADVPPPNDVPLNQWPREPATLVKIEFSWYEYGESYRANKGPNLMSGGPIAPAPGQYDGASLLNTGGKVYNRIICDIGTGVNITMPPSGRVTAELLVPDEQAYAAAGGILPEGPIPRDPVALTRVVPAGFPNDQGTIGYPSARYTQSVYLEQAQAEQFFPIPPLVRSVSAYRSDVAGAGAPIIDFLYKQDILAPLSQIILRADENPVCACPVPENAGFVRVSSNGYTGIVTIVFELDL